MIQVIPAFFALVVAGGLVVSPASAVQAPDAAGTWDVVFNAPDGAHKGKLVIKRDGEALSGAVVGDAGEYKLEGQQKGTEVSMQFTYTADAPVQITMKGTVKADTMGGSAMFGSDPGDWTATRVAAAGAPAGAAQGALDISGPWLFEVTTAAGSGTPAVTFNQSGETLTGQYSGQLGEAPLSGTLKGSALTFSFDIAVQDTKLHVVYTGTAAKDALKGTVTLGELGEGTFTARRK
jgi:hypothetical protein